MTDPTAASVDELIGLRPGAECIAPASLQNAIRINDFIAQSNGTSNAYLLHNAHGRIVINTGMGFEAPLHKKLFDAVSDAPTRYILLTQGHVDHVGGVRLFREAQTQVIAQANNPACQADDARIATVRRAQSRIWFQPVIDAAANAMRTQPEIALQDAPTPDTLFADTLQLTLGDLQIELIATPGGETLDSCVVWLPRHRILFSGNLFGPLFPHFPNFNTVRGDKYRFPENYLASLDRVRALQPAMLITGHGDPIIGETLIRDCFDRLHGAVHFVLENTLRGMNEGQSIFSLMQTVQLPPALRVGEGYGKVSWAVRTIWEAYMGWFHRRSTTELYAEPPHTAYGAILDAAGRDTLLDKADTLATSGEWLKVLHLCEIANAGGACARSVALALRAHEALLANEQENFWLRGWLRYQIRQLQKAQDAP